MRRRKVLIIAILVVILIGLLSMIAGALFITSGPDLTQEDKSILVLCSDKYEQSNGGVDMAFMIELENGTLSNFTPIYPGELSHPTQPAPGGLGYYCSYPNRDSATRCINCGMELKTYWDKSGGDPKLVREERK